MDIIEKTKDLYKQYGQSKSMDMSRVPCYFLHRNFKGFQDLLIIFSTPPCRSECKFCNLSGKMSEDNIEISEQFAYVVGEMRNSLCVLDRFTLSNNGSMLDPAAVPLRDLCRVIEAITQIRNVSTVVLETDVKYLNEERLSALKNAARGLRLNILTGYETSDETILRETLGKTRSEQLFREKLDLIKRFGCDLTCYILYKPSQTMTDEEAYADARRSAKCLIEACGQKGIRLTLRINPMFAARGTEWAKIAERAENYTPPRISQVFELAKELQRDVPTYVGLSTEDRQEAWGTYRIHDDFTKELLLNIVRFNSCKSRTEEKQYD